MIGRLMLGMMAMLAGTAAAQEPFLGEIDLMAFNFAPRGWAMCNGQLLSIQQNTALFSLLGTTYGGDGVQTFALPDLRGRRAVGAGQGPGLSPYVIGQSGGEEVVTLTVAQLPQHNHLPIGDSGIGTSATPGGGFWSSQTQVFLYNNAPLSTVAMSSQAIGTTGGGQPHDNRSPFLVLNYVIALTGIFPSRN